MTPRTVRIGFTRGAAAGAALGTCGSLALYGLAPAVTFGAGVGVGAAVGAIVAVRRRSARPAGTSAADPLLAARVETERARAEAIRDREANRRRPRAEQDAAERRAYIQGASDFAGTDREPPAA